MNPELFGLIASLIMILILIAVMIIPVCYLIIDVVIPLLHHLNKKDKA